MGNLDLPLLHEMTAEETVSLRFQLEELQRQTEMNRWILSKIRAEMAQARERLSKARHLMHRDK